MAEKNRALEEAKAKAEQEKLFQEAQARRAAVAKADRAHLQALHARQEDKALGPIKAKKNSHALSRHTVKYLRISEDNRTFIYEDPPDKKGFGSIGVAKSVHLKNVTSVAPYDAAKPQMLKFKAGHKEYESRVEINQCVGAAVMTESNGASPTPPRHHRDNLITTQV